MQPATVPLPTLKKAATLALRITKTPSESDRAKALAGLVLSLAATAATP